MTRGRFGGSGYDPISPDSQGMQGTDGRYTVRDGDTLAGIAQQMWGDASLWYRLAEANGLSGAETLVAGSSLIIPDKVANVHNSAKTFEVYDPNRALGDLSPTAAKPPKKADKCGMFGQIMMIAIAVAVTAVTGNPILGNLASQGFGLATGIQDKFSWKSLAITAITAGVTAGIGGSGVFASIASTTATVRQSTRGSQRASIVSIDGTLKSGKFTYIREVGGMAGRM